jgi:hypothetical protein
MDHRFVAEHFATLKEEEEDRFGEMAEAVFRFQLEANPVWKRFAGGHIWTGWESVPLLPVDAFKLAPIIAGDPSEAQATFRSSGTGRVARATHYVRDLEVYRQSAVTHFGRIFGTVRKTILAYLPGYADAAEESSLVYMARMLIDEYGDGLSGFTLDDPGLLDRAVEERRPIVLLGAAFGLLDLLDEDERPLAPGSVVIETGGMKTHRREISRADLHKRLSHGFRLPRPSIYSEYGMCEMLSQCYTRGDEVFHPPSWMRLRVVDPLEPSAERAEGVEGALAVYDLANLYSAPFLLTQDRAVQVGRGVRILGRLSGAELRGCNFLIEANE